MRLKSLSLTDYRCYSKLDLHFGDFTCIIGPNGIGKTTILDAISLVSSSLDFNQEQAEASPGGWVPTVTGEQRLKAFLRKNIRNIDEINSCKSFEVKAIFEHENKPYEVILNESGFQKNELLKSKFWWSGITYFAKFDTDTNIFQLREDLWLKFKKAYEEITGFAIEPGEIVSMVGYNIVSGFFMNKPGLGRVHCRKGSAGERKIAKTLSQVVSLEEDRKPHIVLVDNLELHLAEERHLKMIEGVKFLFEGMQIVATTHSHEIIHYYEPKKELIDVGKTLITQNEPNLFENA